MVGAPSHFFFFLVGRLRWVFVAAQAFSSFGEWGATLHWGVRASHFSGASYWGPRALGTQASAVAARGP